MVQRSMSSIPQPPPRRRIATEGVTLSATEALHQALQPRRSARLKLSHPIIIPYPAGDIFFLGADGIGVDGGSGELGVSEPLLHQVERDAGGDGGHPEAVPQPLGRGVRPVEPGGLHDRVHGPPAGHP